MGLAAYEIFGHAGIWRVRHDGKAENVYQTKEAAFEAAVVVLALRQGHEVRVTRQPLAPRLALRTRANPNILPLLVLAGQLGTAIFRTVPAAWRGSGGCVNYAPT
jgi:hypothetical protein